MWLLLWDERRRRGDLCGVRVRVFVLVHLNGELPWLRCGYDDGEVFLGTRALSSGSSWAEMVQWVLCMATLRKPSVVRFGQFVDMAQCGVFAAVGRAGTRNLVVYGGRQGTPDGGPSRRRSRRCRECHSQFFRVFSGPVPVHGALQRATSFYSTAGRVSFFFCVTLCSKEKRRAAENVRGRLEEVRCFNDETSCLSREDLPVERRSTRSSKRQSDSAGTCKTATTATPAAVSNLPKEMAGGDGDTFRGDEDFFGIEHFGYAVCSRGKSGAAGT